LKQQSTSGKNGFRNSCGFGACAASGVYDHNSKNTINQWRWQPAIAKIVSKKIVSALVVAKQKLNLILNKMTK